MNMTDAEKEIFYKHLNASKRYLEFGAGASTTHAVTLPNLEAIGSVESSLPFINDALLSDPKVVEAVNANRLLLHLIDIGETKEWGYPKDTQKQHLWPNYSLSVFNFDTDYDLILIDGRFRVACALASILCAPQNVIIAFHDFWNRPHYQIVLQYLNVVEKVDDLAILSKKENIDMQEVQLLLYQYQYRPER